MTTSIKAERTIIEECGTPRELADRLTSLPEGQYRVFVQRVRGHEEILAGFDRTTEAMRRDPVPETADLSDDDAMNWANGVIQDVRRSSR